jgi:predicted nucleotidyltransferase component of viral defense system
VSRDGQPPTPGGYRNSIQNRAKNAAAKIPGQTAGELADLYYHRRLLARVFHADPDSWVLKGGQALLVRWPAARYSTDIDLLGNQNTTDDAVKALIETAKVQLDDHIRFRHQKTTDQTHVDRPTRTVYFRAMLGNLILRRDVKVDVVVSGHAPRGTVVTEPLEAPFNVDCHTWPDVRMFPIEDHVAEKTCAMYEKHRAAGNTSTRYKDLADLAIIALNSPPNCTTSKVSSCSWTPSSPRSYSRSLPQAVGLQTPAVGDEVGELVEPPGSRPSCGQRSDGEDPPQPADGQARRLEPRAGRRRGLRNRACAAGRHAAPVRAPEHLIE